MSSDSPIVEIVARDGVAANDFAISRANVVRLADQFSSNRHLKKLSRDHLENLVMTAADRKGSLPELKDIHEARRTSSPVAGTTRAVSPERMQELSNQIAKNAAYEERLSATRNTGKHHRHMIETERHAIEKASAGMGFIMAALFAIGALSSFQKAKKADENGKPQWQVSQVGIGLLMSALAVGTAVVSHANWKSAAAGIR